MRSRIVAVVLVAAIAVSGLASWAGAVEASQPPGAQQSSIDGNNDGTTVFSSIAGDADDVAAATRMETVLRDTSIPERDPVDLAIRLGKIPATTLRVARNTPLDYHVGSQEAFYVADEAQRSYFQATATLRYATAHVYMWVQNGYQVSDADLKRSADRFENQTYPTDVRYFGNEWSPGVDGDLHVNIFNGHVPGVGGYYSSSDEFTKAVNQYSNERELFYINLDNARPGTDLYDGILAHEFQHMIHWNQDRNEPTWVNEGLSELAAQLNGFNNNLASVSTFVNHPDTQLTDWADEPSAAAANYGAAHSFMNYLLKRFGADLIHALVADKDNSMASMTKLNDILREEACGVTADDVFADWVVSNFTGAPSSDGRYGVRLTNATPAIAQKYDAYPVDWSSTVHQYGTDYIDLRGSGDLEIDFQGASTARLTNSRPHSGKYEWWSNRGDNSDMTLTHAFDLTGLQHASLDFWTWYDIEKGWDFAYVAVSADGGTTWSTLKGAHCASASTTGNGVDWTFTDVSGGTGDNPQPTWVQEHMDLTPWAGKKILLRFEYVTDDSVDHAGFAVDDIRIPELNFFDDAESDAGWDAHGFVRSDNVVPQRYIVQLIEYGPQVSVQRYDFPSAQPIVLRGLGRDVRRAVLAISAVAPSTTEAAPYHLTITPLDAVAAGR